MIDLCLITPQLELGCLGMGDLLTSVLSHWMERARPFLGHLPSTEIWVASFGLSHDVLSGEF